MTRFDPLKLRTLDLWSYAAPALQDILKDFGLSTKGRNKDELIARLNAHIFQSKFDPRQPKAPERSQRATVQIVDDVLSVVREDGAITTIPLSSKNAWVALQNALNGLDAKAVLWQGTHEVTRPAPGGKRPVSLDDIA